MARLWDAFIPVPDHNELDQLADTNAIIQTKRFGGVWCCNGCRTNYEPKVNFLATLPAYKCDDCNIKNPTAYEWKITETAIQGISLDFMVYDQGSRGHCALYACLGAVDCARKISPALRTVIEAAPFNVRSCLTNFKAHTNYSLERMPGHMSYKSCETVPVILTVFKCFGVPYDLCTRLDPRTAGDQITDSVWIQGFFEVPVLDVLLTTRLVASGYPLVATVDVGKLFRFVGSGDVYSAPADEGIGSHSVVLIGSGVAMRNGEAETYYFVRNSHGPKKHPNHNSQDYGGDFCVWASDVRSIFGFELKNWRRSM